MSCWIVPALAADYLGMSIDEILFRVRAGMLPSKTENGFVFVDVAPNSPRYDEPPARLATFVEVTPAEYAALHAPLPATEAEPEAEPEPADVPEPHWARVRRRTGAARRLCMT